MEKQNRPPREKRHPIQVVARRTGLSPEVLRVWEKRYGVVKPGRTTTGRRVYSDTDIEHLRLLREATLLGRRIGDVSRLATKELAAVVKEDQKAQRNVPPTVRNVARPAEAARYLDECLVAAHDLDAERLRITLRRAFLDLSSFGLIEDLIAPLLRGIGEMWAENRLSPSHEHLASELIRQILGQVLTAAKAEESAPLLLATTPARQRHEIGAMLAAMAALTEGWQIVYLGPDLPAHDIARAAEQADADAVALSIVYPDDDPKMAEELSLLRDHLPERVEILIGGSAAPAYGTAAKRVGARLLRDTRDLRSALAEIRESRERRSR